MSQSTRIKALLNKVFAGKLPTQKLYELLPSKNVQSQHPRLHLRMKSGEVVPRETSLSGEDVLPDFILNLQPIFA